MAELRRRHAAMSHRHKPTSATDAVYSRDSSTACISDINQRAGSFTATESWQDSDSDYQNVHDPSKAATSVLDELETFFNSLRHQLLGCCRNLRVWLHMKRRIGASTMPVEPPTAHTHRCIETVMFLQNTAYDHTNASHEALLASVWQSSFPGTRYERTTREWGQLGFQGRGEKCFPYMHASSCLFSTCTY